MELDMKAMKAEMGGAFMLSWVVLTVAMMVDDGTGTMVAGSEWTMALGAALTLAVGWLAFEGAHILPVVTWCNIMTGDLSDTEGNWMANGTRLVAQVIGAVLAVLLSTEAGTLDFDTAFATSMSIADIGTEYWATIGMIAAGAVWWQIHTRCESAWVSALGMLALAGAMSLTGAHYMGASIAGGGTEIANVLVNWITDGLFVGIGAFVGCKIDDAI